MSACRFWENLSCLVFSGLPRSVVWYLTLIWRNSFIIVQTFPLFFSLFPQCTQVTPFFAFSVFEVSIDIFSSSKMFFSSTYPLLIIPPKVFLICYSILGLVTFGCGSLFGFPSFYLYSPVLNMPSSCAFKKMCVRWASLRHELSAVMTSSMLSRRLYGRQVPCTEDT